MSKVLNQKYKKLYLLLVKENIQMFKFTGCDKLGKKFIKIIR